MRLVNSLAWIYEYYCYFTERWARHWGGKHFKDVAETESKELYLAPSYLLISIHLPDKSYIVNVSLNCTQRVSFLLLLHIVWGDYSGRGVCCPTSGIPVARKKRMADLGLQTKDWLYAYHAQGSYFILEVTFLWWSVQSAEVQEHTVGESTLISTGDAKLGKWSLSSFRLAPQNPELPLEVTLCDPRLMHSQVCVCVCFLVVVITVMLALSWPRRL